MACRCPKMCTCYLISQVSDSLPRAQKPRAQLGTGAGRAADRQLPVAPSILPRRLSVGGSIGSASSSSTPQSTWERASFFCHYISKMTLFLIQPKLISTINLSLPTFQILTLQHQRVFTFRFLLLAAVGSLSFSHGVLMQHLHTGVTPSLNSRSSPTH